MLRYRCNQKGCCCRGWDIPFKLDDFIRLYEYLPEADRAELGAGLKLVVDEAAPEESVDLILKSLKLAGVGEDRHCRFVEGDGGCRVHAQHGIPALPDICVNFPAVGFRDEQADVVELYWDPVCPEVVRIFAENESTLTMHSIDAGTSSAPTSIAAQATSPDEMGWHDAGFAQRVANAREPLRAHLGGIALSRAQLLHLRQASVQTLGDRGRATWESLAAVLNGFRSLTIERALSFTPQEPEDLEAFQRYLGACIGAHGAPLLFWSLRKMERLVFAIDLAPLLANPKQLLAALENWGDALDGAYFAHEQSLRPIFSRYLQHRFAMLYVNQEGELREAADTVALIFGTALRYAGALATALERPVDDAVAQAAISAAEYLYRSLQFDAESLPWYASAEGRPPREKAQAPVQP